MRRAFTATIVTLLISMGALHARSIEQIQESGHLIVAVYEDFPPYSYVENGTPRGIDVEIATQIARSLGVTPRWYFTGADENLDDDLRNLIWRGNLIHKTLCDLMMRVPYDYDYMRRIDPSTGELENDMVFIKAPYQAEQWIVVANKARIDAIETAGIFAYHTVGVEIDTLPDMYLSRLNRGLLARNVRHYRTIAEAVADFKGGKIDAVAGLQSQVEHMIGLDPRRHVSSSRILSVKPWDLGIAVRADFRPLGYHIDEVIETLYASGAIRSIVESYGVTYAAPLSRTAP